MLIRRSKLYCTAPGIITRVGGRPVHNFDLLMMSTWCSKHVEVFNKLIIILDLVHQVG